LRELAPKLRLWQEVIADHPQLERQVTEKKHKPAIGFAMPEIIVMRMIKYCNPNLPDLGMEDYVGVVMADMDPVQLQMLYRLAVRSLEQMPQSLRRDELLDAFRPRAALQ
jgi:hypothetical protein